MGRTFRMSMMKAGMTRSMVAQFCEVHDRTVRRWEDDGAPAVVLKLLDLVAGEIEVLWPVWRGWRMSAVLTLPEGYSVTPGDIRALPYLIRLAEMREHATRDPNM